MLKLALCLVAGLTMATTAVAADMKTYQVRQIARGADTKTSGEVKKGDKVTVMYRMAAISIEVKGGAPKKK